MHHKLMHPKSSSDIEISDDEPGKLIAANDPCPCGSGEKHKHCCLRKDGIGEDTRNFVSFWFQLLRRVAGFIFPYRRIVMRSAKWIVTLLLVPLLLYAIQDEFRRYVRGHILGLGTDGSLPSSTMNWRGQLNDSGNSSHTYERLALPLELNWKSALPAICNSRPVVDAGNLYISAASGARLYGISAKTGAVFWRFEITDQDVRSALYPTQPSPLALSDLIYNQSGSTLRAFRPSEGSTPHWTFNAKSYVRYDWGGPLPSPQVAGQYLLFVAGTWLYKIKRFSGELVNKVQFSGPIVGEPAYSADKIFLVVSTEDSTSVRQDGPDLKLWSLNFHSLEKEWISVLGGRWSPFVTPVLGAFGQSLFVATEGALEAYDTRQGDLIWSTNTPSDGNPVAASADVVVTTYASSRMISGNHIPYSGVSALTPDQGEVIWKKEIEEIRSGGLLALTNKYLFVPTESSVRALRLQDGEEVWSSPDNVQVCNSPIIAEKRLFFIGYDEKSHETSVYSYVSSD